MRRKNEGSGKLIRRARLARGWTQQQLTRGWTQQQLADAIGANNWTSWEMYAIMRRYNVPADRMHIVFPENGIAEHDYT